MLSEKGEELFYKHLYLVEIYSNKLARYKTERDDLYQQGTIGLLEAIKRYDATRGEFKAYAISYIQGYMKKYFPASETIKIHSRNWDNKKEILSLEEDLTMDHTNLEETFCQKEQLQELYRAIQRLDNKHRIILKLFLQGLTVEEIAIRTGYTKRWVYNLYNRAVQEIKGMML